MAPSRSARRTNMWPYLLSRRARGTQEVCEQNRGRICETQELINVPKVTTDSGKVPDWRQTRERS